MIYICIICTSTKPSLLILSDEHRQILEAIVSPTLNLAKLNGFQLWICESCKCLISSVETFKNIALVGTSHLLTKLESVQNERDDQLQSAAQPAVKQDLDDLLEVKTLVKFEIEEEQVNPLQQDEAIKIEYDSDHSAPTTLTNSTEYLKSATADTATKPAVYQPPTLLLLPLTVASFTTEDKQTDNLLLRRLLNETGKLPTLTLHPPSARDSTGDASDNAKEKNTLDNAGKKDEEGHHCSDTSAKSVSQGASGDSTKNPYVWRKVRRRRPLGPVRCKDCHARFYDEAGLAKHNERFHKELHVCEICNKEFISKYKFKCHVGMHKKKAEQSVDTINPEFCCTECGIQFQTKALHKAHFNSLKHTPRDKWKKSSLLSLSDEHRRILETIVSPTINLAQLQSSPLWTCDCCQDLINTVETFKNQALEGASHLLSLLASEQKKQDKSEDLQLSAVKEEPGDLLETKCFIEFEIDEEKWQQPGLEDVKTEYIQPVGNDSEASQLTNPLEPCQDSLPFMLDTTELPPLVSKPTGLSTVVVYNLPPTSSSGDAQTSLPVQPPTLNKTVEAPTFSMQTLSTGGSTDDKPKKKRKRDDKVLELFMCRTCGDRIPISQINSHTSQHTPPYRCYSCSFETSYISDIVIHRCHGVIQQENGANSQKDSETNCFETSNKSDMPHSHGVVQKSGGKSQKDTKSKTNIETGKKVVVRQRCDAVVKRKNVGKSQKKDSESKTKTPTTKVPRKKRSDSHKSFRCSDCYVRFVDEAGLAKHLQKYQNESDGVHVCELCKKEFKSKCRLKIHLTNHRRQESQSADASKPELFCEECGLHFPTKQRFNSHMNSLKHTTRDKWKFKCDECGKQFVNKYELKMHVNFVHLENVHKPKHQCSQCSKVFRRGDHLRKHVDIVHEGKAKPRPHVCHECGAAFTAKQILNEHLTTHSDVRPHACPLCPATFKFKAALFTHNRLKHLKVKGNWKPKGKGRRKLGVDTDSSDDA